MQRKERNIKIEITITINSDLTDEQLVARYLQATDDFYVRNLNSSNVTCAHIDAGVLNQRDTWRGKTRERS